MALPYFFVDDLQPGNGEIVLNEDTSKHITGVLRMKAGEKILLTNGRGGKGEALIMDDHRKRCAVRLAAYHFEEQRRPEVAIAISLVKTSARFEWFLEKATEIGVQEIYPLLCARTEKEKFRSDRMKNILVSAMLQSQQCWMPQLHEPVAFEELVGAERSGLYTTRLIAHCLEEEKASLVEKLGTETGTGRGIILIGPEGDFTPGEIESARAGGYQPVALGDTRLRTETAGVVAATLMRVR